VSHLSYIVEKNGICITSDRERAANGRAGEYAATTGRTQLRAGRADGSYRQSRHALAIGPKKRSFRCAKLPLNTSLRSTQD